MKRLFVQKSLSPYSFFCCVVFYVVYVKCKQSPPPIFNHLSQCARGDFSILSEQDPKRVLPFAKILLILYCRRYYTLGTTYLMKVFSLLSLIRNLTVSNKDEDTTTLISCIAMWLCTLCAHTPYYPSVGSCNRLFVLGFVRTSYQINGSQLHTFCFFNTLARSIGSKKYVL